MEENYGKIVSNIRTAKGVPIGKLISGVCSRTAYRNFVMNQTGTSVDNFMRLLAKLHVSYTEFKYIANGFETDYEQRFVIDLQKAIAQGNLKRLDALLQRTLNYCAIYENDEKYSLKMAANQLNGAFTPFLIWTTIDYTETKDIYEWISYDEKNTYTYPKNSHVVVVTGVDENYYYINDPLKSEKNIPIEKDILETSFDSLGRQLLLIETYELPEDFYYEEINY